ncbi:MAG: hypothetical protein U1E76_13335 [Planctomycetota bacterium]
MRDRADQACGLGQTVALAFQRRTAVQQTERVDAAVHHRDAALGDAVAHQLCLDRLRDRNVAIDAVAVLEAAERDRVPVDAEVDAARDDGARVTEQVRGKHADGVRVRRVHVHDVEAAPAQQARDRGNGHGVPLDAHRDQVTGEAGGERPLMQLAARLRAHLGGVAELLQPGRERQGLLLATTPGALGIDVQDAQGCHAVSTPGVEPGV